MISRGCHAVRYRSMASAIVGNVDVFAHILLDLWQGKGGYIIGFLPAD